MQTMAKTLTFVVPAYNMEMYLDRCVESLLAVDDTSDVEVLIVDDGSSDGTAALADGFAERYPDVVKAIHQPNKGHGGAVCAGIAAATGMYVKVVDADDWIDAEAYGQVMDVLRRQVAIANGGHVDAEQADAEQADAGEAGVKHADAAEAAGGAESKTAAGTAGTAGTVGTGSSTDGKADSDATDDTVADGATANEPSANGTDCATSADAAADETADGAESNAEPAQSAPVDMVVVNYVYDKVGKKRKHVVNFRRAMEPGRVLTWDDLGHFGISEYILMHALIYRTEVVRQSKLSLPEHTFYVDFIYSYQPFPWVKTMLYVDVPFYHYFIGREGQSVQTDAMIRRVDQLLLINHLMVRATPEPGTVPDGLYRYMIHYLSIQSTVTSAFLVLSKRPANFRKRAQLWADMRNYSAAIYRDTKRQLPSRAIRLRGPAGRWLIRVGYRVAEKLVGFN